MHKILSTINYLIPPTTFFGDNIKYRLEDTWFSIYKEGHYTIPHFHEPCFLSFIYYLKTDKNSSPLIFDRTELILEVTNDLLVLFPSYLIHSVDKQKKGDDRICLAGNIVVG
jgi:hypothetical protein